jgi:hypothetical protein
MKDGCLAILKPNGWGWLIHLFFVIILIVQLPLQASATKDSYQVEYINKRLAVKVDNIPLGSVLTKIKEKTGVEFVVNQEQSGKLISCQQESLPLVEGLKRLLRQFNHAMFFGPDNKPIKVIILGYTNGDIFPRSSEGTETPSVQRDTPPLTKEIQDTKPTDIDDRIVGSSSELTKIIQPAGEDIISTPSSETKVTKFSSVEEMIVRPPSETMAIRPTPVSVEDMMIPTPPDVIAYKVKNMIIGGFTEDSRSKVR